MGNLKFGNIYTKDLDLIIQTEPIYVFPAKDITVEHIPGRNGDLIIDNKCWQNVERSYSIASVFRPGTNFISNAEKLIKFLTESKGYQRLEDTYDPDVYRLAQYKNSGSLKNYYDQATAIEVVFDCKPQRYLKSGDKPISFLGSSATLENPTGKPALPIISISNIVHSDNIVMLVTIKNNDIVTSTVTLSDVPSGDVIIDSELQTVASIQNGDINRYVSLNDKEFPVLNNGNNEVIIEKFTEDTTIVDKYELIMNSNKYSFLALYKPYDAIVESKQKSFYIKSFNLLKQQCQEVYEAKAYSNYCIDKSEHYTFISFNTVMEDTSQSYTFQTDYTSAPDWLEITENGDKIIVYVGDLSSFNSSDSNLSGEYAYFISNNDKVVRRLKGNTAGAGQPSNGWKIGEFNKSSTITITVYPAKVAHTPSVEGDLELAIDYSDYNMPNDWLSFSIDYDKSYNDSISGQTTWTLKSISFKSNASGYYYLPKTGLFGKAGWSYLSSGTELTSLSWNTSKRKFMPTGISTSTTASFTYYYLSEIPQYEPTYKEVLDENGNVKKDSNGNPIMEIDNAVHFVVEVLNQNLTSIKYKAKEAGYYRCNDGDQGSAWKYLGINADIPSSCGFVNTTSSSNIVYYMAELPTYDKVDGFPEWLDPEPILAGSDVQNGNPTTVDFKVKESNWFRYTFMSGDNTLYTEWVYKESNSNLGVIYPATTLRDAEESFTVYMIEGSSEEFPIKEYSYTDASSNTIKDIGFFYIDSEGHQQEYENNQPPSWIKVIVNPGSLEDGSDTTITFNAGSAGSFNWDLSAVWITKAVNAEILTSGSKDDTTIYYLSSMPIYPTTYTYFDIVVNTNEITGNPESIKFIVKNGYAGYYRAKNNTNWKYYYAGDEICESKISESTTIYKLNTVGNFNNITITITPRWWEL